jgi:hypothetical protein
MSKLRIFSCRESERRPPARLEQPFFLQCAALEAGAPIAGNSKRKS